MGVDARASAPASNAASPNAVLRGCTFATASLLPTARRAAARQRAPLSSGRRRTLARAVSAAFVCVLAYACLARLNAQSPAPIAGANVNAVRGTKSGKGDPFLQRQNEPSLAVSTRNECHALLGMNDYSLVNGKVPDPNLPPAIEPGMVGDAWLGYLETFDCGARWQHSLLPGFPGDTSAVGQSSPLYGFAFGADPTVRAGANGLLFLSGLVSNRGDNQPSKLFIARFVDDNNKEKGDTIRLLSIETVTDGSTGQFVDKPWLAVDIPRTVAGQPAASWTTSATTKHENSGGGQADAASTCTIDGKTFPAGNVYMAWARFEGDSARYPTKIMFGRSGDCGKTWKSHPISNNQKTSQGTSIAIAPDDGTVFVSWRELGRDGKPHAIHITRSRDGGKTFDKPRAVASSFQPFDQGRTQYTFRTIALPAVAAGPDGLVWVAFSARGYAKNPDGTVNDDGRIVLAVSKDGGQTFGAPLPIEARTERGHQIMPALTYAAGKLQLVFYDFRDDRSLERASYVSDANAATMGRHTVDVRAAWADATAQPHFVFARSPDGKTDTLSRYETSVGKGAVKQNFVNLPLYALGTTPFIGDYIDIAALSALPVRNADGSQTWIPNTGEVAGTVSTQSTVNAARLPPSPVGLVAWDDHRDVKIPPGDMGWEKYNNPGAEVCDPNLAGIRNANIYTARLTAGLFVGSPGNTKPLGYATNKQGVTETDELIQRGFVVFAQNTLREQKRYRFTIVNQPAVGVFSFRQFDRRDPACVPDPANPNSCPPPLTRIDAEIPALSTVARTVYARATEKYAQILVNIVELTARTDAAGNVVYEELAGGRRASVLFNPDNTNPDILDPDLFDPADLPQVAKEEVHNPSISFPIYGDVTGALSASRALVLPKNPDPEIPDPEIKDPENPDPEIPDPEIPDPEIDPVIPDPEIPDPEIPDPEIVDLENTALGDNVKIAAMRDVHWVVKNRGNTASAYYFRPTVKGDTGNLKFQLIVTRKYLVPRLNPETCKIENGTVSQVVVNIPDFQPRTPDPEIPDPEIPDPEIPDPEIPDPEIPDPEIPDPEIATFQLAPDESAIVTLRVIAIATEPATAADDDASLAAAFDDGTGDVRGPAAEAAASIQTTITLNPATDTAAQVTAQAANSGDVTPQSAASGPDLILSEPPPFADVMRLSPGEDVNVTFTIKNRGTGPADTEPSGGTLKTRFYLSVNADLSPDDLPLAPASFDDEAAFFHAEPLPIGVCSDDAPDACVRTRTQTLRIPGEIATGDYYLIVITDDDNDVGENPTVPDPDNEVFEADETNSWSFVFLPVVPFTLSFAAPVSDANAGATLEGNSPIVVTIRDSRGNAVSWELVPDVTMSIGANPGNGTLGGTPTQPNGGGMATFANLSIDAPGGGYTLSATAARAAAVTSNAFLVNGVPVAAEDSYSVGEDQTLNGSSVLANDTDFEGAGGLQAVLVSGPAHGSLNLLSNGTFVYTPGSNFFGADSFTYRATDGRSESNLATVSIDVASTPDAPVANPDSAETFTGVPIDIAVLANDTDADGDTLVIQSVTSPSNGTAVIDGNSVRYTPNAGFSGNDSFSYTARDPGGLSATALVSVSVRSASAAPVANPDQATTFENTPVTLNVLGNDRDPDGVIQGASQFEAAGLRANVPFINEIVVNPATGLVYFGGGGGSQKIGVLDPSSNRLAATVPVASTLGTVNMGVANPATGFLYFRQIVQTTQTTHTIVAVDGRPTSAAFNSSISVALPAAKRIQAFAVDSLRGLLYVSTFTPQPSAPSLADVTIVDVNPTSAAFHQIVATVALPNGAQARGIAVNVETNKIYVAVAGNLANAGLWIVDGSSRTAVRVPNTTNNGISVAVNQASNLVYMTTSTGSGEAMQYQIQAIDGPTGTLLATIPVSVPLSPGNFAERMAVHEGTGYVYVKSASPDPDSVVVVVDGNRTRGTFNTIVATIPVAADSGAELAIDEGANRLVVASGGALANSVAVIDTTTNAVVTTYSTNGSSRVSVNQATHKAYVQEGIGGIRAIDLLNVAWVKIPTGVETGPMVVNPANGMAFGGRTSWTGTNIHTATSDGSFADVTNGIPHKSGRYVFFGFDNSRQRVYAANAGSDLTQTRSDREGFVTVINAADQNVMATIPAGAGPFGVAVNEATNKVYVANLGGANVNGGITIIDGQTFTTTQADVSAFGAEVGFGRDIVVSATGKVYARLTNSSLEDVSAGVLNPGNNVVTPLPASLGVVRLIRADLTRNRIYLGTTTGAQGELHYVKVLNADDDSVIGTIPYGFPSTFVVAGYYLAIDESRNRLYVANFLDDTVSVVDGATFELLGTVPVGDGPTAVVVNEAQNRIFVSNPGDKTLSVIDGETLAEVSRLALPLRAVSLALDPVRQRLFTGASVFDDGGVMVLSDEPAHRNSMLTVAISNPAAGSTQVNADQTITYTPPPFFFGNDGFSYTVSDGRGGSALASVTVSVLHPNQPPQANDDLFATNEDTARSGNVLENDTDDGGTLLTAFVVRQPTFGTLLFAANGNFTYTPQANFNGTDSFVYQMTDSSGGSSRATATLIVNAVDDGAMGVGTWQAATHIAAIPGAGNVDAIAAVDGGNVNRHLYIKELAASGESQLFEYRPDGTVNRSRTFTVANSVRSGIVVDMNGDRVLAADAATNAIVRLDPANAFADTVFSLPWTLDQQSDLSQMQFDETQFASNLVYFWDNTQATVYKLDRNASTLTPLRSFDTGTPAGSHVVTKFNDLAFEERLGRLLVSVGGTNTVVDPAPGLPLPVVVFGGLPGTPQALAVDDFNGKAYVQIGDSIYGGSPDDGTLRLVATIPGLVDFAVGLSVRGPGQSIFALAGRSIYELYGTGAAPVARDDSITINEDQVVNVAVMANDTDPGGAPLTIVSFTQPAAGQGTVQFGPDRRTLQFTPAPNFAGMATFTYLAANFHMRSPTATVTVNVAAVNDAPIANGDSYDAVQNQTLSVAAPGVLANDTDPDGPNPLTAVLVSPPSSGNLTLNSDGSFTYVPATGTEFASFTYRASDGVAQSNTRTVGISVRAPLTITTTALREAVLFEGYGQFVSWAGGRYPVTLTLDPATGPLPDGLNFSSGNFSGTPLATGIFDNVIVRATDSSTPVAQTDTQEYTLRSSARDQQNWSFGTVAPVAFGPTSGRELAQVLTTGAQGDLSAVRVEQTTCDADAQLSIEIQGVTGDFPARPNGTVLASGLGAPGFTPVQLTPTVFLPVESPVAIVIRAIGGNCQTTNLAPEDFYRRGTAFTRTAADGGNGPWQTLQSTHGAADLVFSNLVIPENLAYMSAWRDNGTATTLGDGRVLIVGGWGTTRAETYDPATHRFTRTANDMPQPRVNATATLLSTGKVLIVGGATSIDNQTVELNTAVLYDPATNQFTPVASNLSAARQNHTATLLGDGRVLIYGGERNSDGFTEGVKTVEIFNGTTFTSLGDRPAGRFFHTATRFSGNKVLIVGGYWTGDSAASVEVVDVDGATITFSTDVGQLPESRAEHTAALLQDGSGRVLIGGGWSGSDLAASYLLFNPATNGFADGGPMVRPRIDHSMVTLADGTALLMGGTPMVWPDRDPSASVERYVPPPVGIDVPGSASAAGMLKVTRSRFMAAMLQDGRILAAGGWSRSDLSGRAGEVYAFTANGFRITTGQLPDGFVNQEYPETFLQTTGATGAVDFAVVSGAPPRGLTLESSGRLSGEPESAGPHSFVVRARDLSTGNTAFAQFTIVVNRLVITTTNERGTPTTLPDGVRGQPYSAQLEATGFGTKTWSITWGSLPTGLSMTEGGAISGTIDPDYQCCSSFEVMAVDAAGQTARKWLFIPVNDVLTIQTTSADLPDATAPWGFGAGIQVTGGRFPYHFGITVGTLPQTLTLQDWGGFTGNAYKTGMFTFTVRATDSSGPEQVDTRTLTLRSASTDENHGWVANPAQWVSFGGDVKVAQVTRSGLDGVFFNIAAPVECTSTALLLEAFDVMADGQPDFSKPLGTGVVPAGLILPFTGDPWLRQLKFSASVPAPYESPVAFVMSSAGDCRIALPRLSDPDHPNGSGYVITGNDVQKLSANPGRPDDFPFWTAIHPNGEFAWTQQGRSTHTATLLPNGKVLLAGGTSFGPSAVIFDPATGLFTPTVGAMAKRRVNHTATLLGDGRVLIVGGHPADNWGGAAFRSAEIYDPASGAFQEILVDGPSWARAFHTATLLLNGNVLITGGTTGGGQPALKSTEIYGVGTNTFIAGPDMSRPRAGHQAVMLTGTQEGSVLITGGWGAGGGTRAEKYVGGTFFPLTLDMQRERSEHIVEIVQCPGRADPCVLVAGGWDGSNGGLALATELFDVANDRFISGGMLGQGRSNPRSVSYGDGSAAVIGGSTFGPHWQTPAVERYDPTSGAFEVLRPLGTDRAWHTATLLPGNVVLVAGGSGMSQAAWHSAEVYDLDTAASALTIATIRVNDGVVGQEYSFTIESTPPAAIYEIVRGAAPPGLTFLQANGMLTGTPTQAGSFRFVVKATLGTEVTTRGFFMDVGNPLNITTASLPDGTEGAEYAAQLQAQGGISWHNWRIYDGSFPTGLGLFGDGRITGTPTTAGNYTFRVEVSDSGTPRQSRIGTFTINVAAAAFATVVTTGAPNVAENALSIARTTDAQGAFTGFVVAGETSANGTDVWIHKFAASGNQEWQKRLDIGNAIAVKDSVVAVAGATADNAFFAKFNIDTGEPAVPADLWARVYGTPAATEDARALVALADGYAFAGYWGGDADGDAWLVRLNSDGDLVWQRRLGAAGADSASALALGDGGLLVAGSTTSVDPSADFLIAGVRLDGSAECPWTGSSAERSTGMNHGAMGFFNNVDLNPNPDRSAHTALIIATTIALFFCS